MLNFIIDPKCSNYLQMRTIDPFYKITPELSDKARKFAEECAKTNHDRYARRGQGNLAAIVEQIATGKIVEQAVYDRLVPFFPNLTPPDWEIYDGTKKNWDHDLHDDVLGINIGCKSQMLKRATKYGASWIFQNRENAKYDKDVGVFGEEAKQDGNFICFASIDDHYVYLQALIATSTLHEHNLFKEPVKQDLKNNKKAVYLEDIERVMNG